MRFAIYLAEAKQIDGLSSDAVRFRSIL